MPVSLKNGPDSGRRAIGRVALTVVDDGTTSEANRLGAIGDIRYCISRMKLDDDLLVIAGDNLFTYQLADAWQHFRSHGEDMILAQPLPQEEDLRRFAIVSVDDRGLVADLEEKPQQPKSNLAVYATYFYRRDTLPLFDQYLAEGNNPDSPGHFPVWLYKRKPVRVFFFDGLCIDIGTPQSYEDVRTTFPCPRLANREVPSERCQKRCKCCPCGLGEIGQKCVRFVAIDAAE